ncbi:MAG TPA: universal stress protein [Gemmatimonadaceae bacterium]|jgi:nucleotide-binding universal stress UspA family protein
MRLLTLRKILVATDFDDGSRAALMTARALAKAADAEVHVVHVSREETTPHSLAALVDDVGLSAHQYVRRGDAAHAINILSDEIGADAILLGEYRKRREAQGRVVLGSTAMAVVTNAAVPCLVVSQPLQIPVDRTVAAVDLSDSARGTLAVALSWTSALRQRDTSQDTILTVLHVSGSLLSDHRKRALEKLLASVRDEAGTWARTTIESVISEKADPTNGVVEYARDHRANLVVLGTRGLGQDKVGRLGSVSAEVMQQLDTPVLLVPPSMWIATPDTPS